MSLSLSNHSVRSLITLMAVSVSLAIGITLGVGAALCAALDSRVTHRNDGEEGGPSTGSG